MQQGGPSPSGERVGPPPAPHRVVGTLCAIACTLGIAFFTLRSGSRPLEVLEPAPFGLSGDEGLEDFISNVVLFAPFGFACVMAGLRARTTVLVGGLYALAIEVTQGAVLTWRDAAAADVVANTVGAAVGALLALAWPMIARPSPALARRLAAIGFAAALSLLTLSGWLTMTEDTGRHYLGQYAGPPPPDPPMSAFGVLALRANGIPIPWGAVRDNAALRATSTTQLELTGVVRGQPDGWLRLGGLHEVDPHFGRQRIKIDWDGRAWRMVARSRAERALLKPPYVALPLFEPASVGDTVSFTAETGLIMRLVVRHRGVERSVSAFTPLLGWMTIVPGSLAPNRALWAFSLLWLLCLFGPPAWWTWCARRAARPPDAQTR